MERYVIEGGHPLKGEIEVTGAKNAVLGIIPAAILASDTFQIENVPQINDVQKYISILEKLGAKVEFEGNDFKLDTTGVNTYDCAPFEDEVSKMRASYYLLGALLGRFGEASVPLPGGCSIGDRPIDLHMKGFRALGADVDIRHGMINVKADKLKGANIYLDFVSVGATINIMLAAVLAEGITVIENAAREPHVVDVANFLNQMGARIVGAGTDTIKIYGTDKLHGCNYSVVPDQITTGTYMIAAAATEGDVFIKNAIPKHMEALTSKMREMGIDVETSSDGIRVRAKRPFKGANVKTLPYPGFPTDLQQPLAVLMMLADGRSTINESIFDNRFKYIEELRKMGADAVVSKNICFITGVPKLLSSKITATDLRAGAAAVIAGLAAEGTTVVSDIHYIDRGYEKFEENLSKLGAKIRREKSPVGPYK